MMEPAGKNDEFKWAMKRSFMKHGRTDSWKHRKKSDILGNVSVEQIPHVSSTKSNQSLEQGHMKIMASLVPDEIIYKINDYSKREFDACLLFGDVSGFTELTEKYNKTGKGGPSRLTQVLNAYIGAMVQEILSHSGDVLKFSGDAFIALFKETDHLSLRNAVHEAIDCSLVIQKSYGTYKTDVDVLIRVKLAVACGHLVFSLVGDQENSHYLMTGQPIMDIKAAESMSKAGEIIISARVSHHISANEYLVDLLPDGIHAKVLGVGPNWRNIQRSYTQSEGRYSIFESQEGDGEAGSEDSSTLDNLNVTARTGGQDQYELRPAVNYATRIKLKDELRKFIIAPVMRGIDAGEPLEYLTEIRQVAILFINCKVSEKITNTEGIDVGNQVYLTVCSVVKDRYACVNKISNFDKDLMLLTIFGLRGFKHELESQIALRCAKKCRDKLLKIQYVETVSAAVTTGKTYCGAFGHTLRREYTVIGLIVNKAARLMVAYADKVTCCRETFLHSKLESKHFILQEPKPLKGIANPGPIYEFKEVEKSQDMSINLNPLPLLGREKEMNLYKTLLKITKRGGRNVQNMLIIRGAYRQGKTRVLEEILCTTDPTVAVHRFTVTPVHYELPYYTIQMIFCRFLGTLDDPCKQRMMKIEFYLRNTIWMPYLRLLNAIFQVEFDSTYEYGLLDDESKYKRLLELFDNLANRCFDTFWLIAIDDSEYVDDESWFLMDNLICLNTVFIATTMGIEKEISTLALEILKNPKIKSIELKGIDKWYHVGLACQMLRVDGIPPELEKTIQTKSNGNPGWIESFLVTVTQSGGITFSEMTRAKAFRSGLIVSPLYMLVRLSKDELDLWNELMEEHFSKKSTAINTRWKMFVESCRESFPDLNVAQMFADKVEQKNDTVRIAQVNPEFNLSDVDPEKNIDVVILKTFDALTSYEQLLLKCSAILGDVFPRDMLLYIMSSSAMRLTAIAVKKLFEIHVLSCARGNFIEGGLSFKERLLNPNDDMSVKCDCKGLIIDELCIDLPKYASCGYMRFRSSEFRETTYNLLTDNQKREFHEKAIRYLEKETRRCRACGNGYFVHQMGVGRLDYTLRNVSERRKSRKKSFNELTSQTMSEADALGLKSQAGSFISFDSVNSRSKEFLKPRETISLSSGSNQDADMVGLGETRTTVAFSRVIGINAINKLKDNFNLCRTFSNSDYSQCTCLLIQTTMYSQLIDHCKGACLAEKIMNATIEYAYVCIETKNIPQAIKMLEEALALLDGPMKDQIELEWMISLKKGKLFALLGRARLELNDDEAYYYFKKALKCYGVKFPTTGFAIECLKLHYKLWHFCRLYIRSNEYSDKKIDDDISEYCNNVSECLCFLCEYFQSKKRLEEAEVAALWSLLKALKTETDFAKLCFAYGNLIQLESLLGHHRNCVALEVYALTTCHKKRTNVELEELKSVSYLYFYISCSRIRRAEMEKYIHIGYVTWRIASSSQTDWIVFKTLPMLSYAILMRRQVVEYGNLLQEILYIVDQDIDDSIKAWYYALSLQLHLETGVSSEPYSKCMKYMQSSGMAPTTRDPEGKNRLIVCIWLWEVRNENWDAANMYRKPAWKFEIENEGSTIQNLITACYLLEGLIIYMVSKMDMKNLLAVNKADARIQDLFDKLGQNQSNCKFIKARLMHLKAYYTISKDNNYKRGMQTLAKAKKVAEKCTNDLELAWLNHSEMAWLYKLSREEMDFWKDHTDEDNLIDFRDVEYMEKCVQYSLPLPLYI